jgi:hypothetical protein
VWRWHNCAARKSDVKITHTPKIAHRKALNVGELFLKLFRQNLNDRLSPTLLALLPIDFFPDFPVKPNKLGVDFL